MVSSSRGQSRFPRLWCWRRCEWPPANAVMLLPCQPAAKKRPLATRSLRKSTGYLVLIVVVLLLIGREESRAATQIRYASRIVETKSGQIRGILQVCIDFLSLRCTTTYGEPTANLRMPNIDFRRCSLFFNRPRWMAQASLASRYLGDLSFYKCWYNTLKIILATCFPIS